MKVTRFDVVGGRPRRVGGKCKRGHDVTGSNAKLTKAGYLACRACNRVTEKLKGRASEGPQESAAR